MDSKRQPKILDPDAARHVRFWKTTAYAMACAAFVVLVAGIVGTSIGLGQAVRARDAEATARKEADTQRDAAIVARTEEQKQRRVAEAQRDEAEKIADFMSDTPKGAGPNVARGRDITMLKEMMDAAAARIEKGDLRTDPQSELRLRTAIGNTYRELALYPEASNMLEPAVALAKNLHDADHSSTADALSKLARLLTDRGDLAGAEQLWREALAMIKRLFPGDDRRVAQAQIDLAVVLRERGDLAGAEQLFRESLEMNKRLHPGDSPEVARGLGELAALLQARGEFASAEALYSESLQMYRRLFGDGDHPAIVESLLALSQCRAANGELTAAIEPARNASEMAARLFPEEHPLRARCDTNLAQITAKAEPKGSGGK